MTKETKEITENNEFDADKARRGSASGTEIAYSVEVRYAFGSKLVGDTIIGEKWQALNFYKSPIGVPVGGFMTERSNRNGLLSYPAAQALRWWFLADMEASSDFSVLGFETRLVKHEFKYTEEHKAVSAHCLISGDDRSSMMPDWNKK